VCVLPTVPLDDAFVLEENLSHPFNLMENLSLQEKKTSPLSYTTPSNHVIYPWPRARTRCTYGYEPATWHPVRHRRVTVARR
jgi:hypothetical protein